jgi:hypothetical protein
LNSSNKQKLTIIPNIEQQEQTKTNYNIPNIEQQKQAKTNYNAK